MPIEQRITNHLGFTLVEILVVLVIMGIIGITTYLNIGTFREDENLKSVASDLQSYFRLAQSNAQTGVKCENTGGTSWSIVITDRTSIKLKCQTQQSTVREWTIKTPAQIDSIEGIGTLSCFSIKSADALINPVTVIFSYLEGKAAFLDPQNKCLSESASMRIKIRKKVGSTDTKNIKTITVSKGGSIDVQ